MLDPSGHVVKGLGMRLPGSKRLMDELTNGSTVGNATTAIVRKWLK
jgi:anti-sigma regulatory factor (Ser/Thr protein kinase)